MTREPGAPGELSPAVAGRLRALGVEEGQGVLVGLSGGLDSTVLLHLLRFGGGLDPERLSAAHFDHRMRAGSAADAAWVRGLARAWEVPLEEGAAEKAPSGEAVARALRYAFLKAAAGRRGARWILTGHHADDQAETVLFRLARGTGLAGLAGIPHRRPPGILRPLLPFPRALLEAYARRVGIRPRDDPTNVAGAFARNVIRHRVIPLLEAEVAPAARRSLARVARLARENERAWDDVVPRLLENLVVDDGADRIVLRRPDLLGYDPTVRARLLRALLRRLGSRPDEAGTRAVLEFSSSGVSGGRVDLPGGVVLGRSFDRLVLSRTSAAPPAPDRTLEIREPGVGSGVVRTGGVEWRVRWSLDRMPDPAEDEEVERFDPGVLRFPLRVRGWSPGDRIRLPYGSKKLKKLFGEARIERAERERIPVVADAGGAVLWVLGLARSTLAVPGGRERAFSIGVTHGDHS